MVFLPGASGSGDFWRPVGKHLPDSGTQIYLDWPGLGDQPHAPSIQSFEDLVGIVVGALERPSDLIAHSLGGVVALRVALRHPELVRRLVLCVTSGGVDVAGRGGADWRGAYRAEFPAAAGWIFDPISDQTAELPRISAPTLLVWGDADPISPVAVGRHLAALLPRSRLEVIRGGTHDLAREHPGAVAALIASHLARSAP